MDQPAAHPAHSDAGPRETSLGAHVLRLAEELAQHSETATGLTCTYFSDAHLETARTIARQMTQAGLAASIDVVGNVSGFLRSGMPGARTLLIGSHYDTVRDAGKYDGRLGIVVAIAALAEIVRSGSALPFNVEVLAFSEEEGIRFSAPYIGSSAVAGRFDEAMLARRDASGASLAEVLGLAGNIAAIRRLARDPASLCGYLEIHMEQGPVLTVENASVGVVTAISGNTRLAVSVWGEAGHAGTMPMTYRHDAAAAAAEIVLAVEKRGSAPGVLATVGKLSVPDGAINTIPGCCDLTIDVRSGDNSAREAAAADIRKAVEDIAARRGVAVDVTPLLDARAVACAPRWQDAFEQSVRRAGLPIVKLLSGAGHDAVMFDGVTDIGVLFVRCGNGGISHSPLESVTAEDAGAATRVLIDVLTHSKP